MYKRQATNSGDGGRVIVWSDDYTNFSGSISAKGSSEGNGGFVETSSKNNLQVFGSVDAGGGISAGEWVLDPANVTIGSGTGTQVIGSTVAKALNKIEINKTDGAGAETGTITIDDIGTATTYGAGTNGTTTDAVYIGNAHTTAEVLK